MPINTTIWRTHPQLADWYAWISRPATVLNRSINQSSFSYPITQLTYDNPSSNPGSYTDVKVGMTVRFEDSGGTFKGWGYIREAPLSDTFYIGVTSRGVIAFADNDIIKVLKDYRLYSKIPYIDSSGTQFKEYTRSFVAASAQPPVARITESWYAKQVSGGIITVSFSGTSSYAIANGASISSYLWNVDDGTITVGSTTTSTITATFPAGERWVSLTVTDSNGNTHTTRAFVFGGNETTYRPLHVIMGRLAGDIGNGWECAFTVLETDTSGYYDGSPVIVWADEFYGANNTSLSGASGREQVKFCGWLLNETIQVEPYNNDNSFSAGNAQRIMSQLPAFDQAVLRATSPTSWFEAATLTHWRYCHYIMHWHSNLLEVCSIERPTHYDTYPVTSLETVQGSLYDQLKFLAEAVRAKFSVDHHNIGYFRYWPQLMTSGERASLNNLLTAQDTDWTDSVLIERDHRDKISLVNGSMVLAHATTIDAFLSAAPGKAPGQGMGQAGLDRQLGTGQSDLNDRVGRIYYYNNQPEKGISLQIKQQGMVVDPCWQETVQFTLAADSNRRGKSYSNQPLLPTTVDLSFDHGSGTTQESWTLEKLVPTTVISGITVLLPGETTSDSEYIDEEGTFLEQEMQPYEDYAALENYVPDELTNTLDAGVLIGWSSTLQTAPEMLGSSTDWSSEHAPGGETSASFIHEGNPTPLGDPVIGFHLTNAALYRNTDVYGAGSWSSLSALVGGSLLRVINGSNKVVTFGATISTGTWTKTFDFTISAHDWKALEATFEPGAFWGSYAAGVGWNHGDGKNTAGTTARRVLIYRYSEPFDLRGMEITYNLVTGGDLRLTMGSGDDGTSGVTLFYDTPTPTTGTAIVVSQATSRDDEGVVQADVRADIEANPADLTGSSRITQIKIDGTGYNPYVDTVFFKYWNGSTLSTCTAGLYANDQGGDVDDYNLGVMIGGAENGIWYANSYSASNATELTGLTGITYDLTTTQQSLRPHVTCVRIPFKKLASQAPNNDASSIQFIYGINKTVGGKTLWGINFNANTGAISAQSDMTPIITGTTFYVIGAEALETAGQNTQVILALVKPMAGGNTALIYSANGGGSWVIRNSNINCSFVRWLPGSTTQAWIAGVDGIFFTNDAGVTLTTITGDFTGTPLGAYGFLA